MSGDGKCQTALRANHLYKAGTEYCVRLLNNPAKAGRLAEYTAERVVRLERIKRLQADGHTQFRDRSNPERAFREEVRNGTADGVVAACDCRRRHRVGESRCQLPA
jgi:hypothetical protein